MKKVIVVIAVIVICFIRYEKVSGALNLPDWILNTPQDSEYYYFTGMGVENDIAKASKIAEYEITGNVLYMINTTIKTSTSFEQVYTQDRSGNTSSLSKLFKRIKTKGFATISRLEFIKRHPERKDENRWVVYVLGRMPKSEINETFKKVKAQRERLATLKTACVVLIRTHDKKVRIADELKPIIEQFYKDGLGYNVVDANIDINVLQNLSSLGRLNYKLKEMLTGFNFLVVGVIDINMKPLKKKFTVVGYEIEGYGVKAALVLRVLDLSTMSIIDSNDYPSIGVSTSSEEDAMNNLLLEARRQILDEEESSSDTDVLYKSIRNMFIKMLMMM